MPPKRIFPRLLSGLIKEHLGVFPIVLVEGPRQAGKTTLVKELASELKFDYLSLDDKRLRAVLDMDEVRFVAELDRAVIDEIQERPELLRTLKMAVDERSENGIFILTGSSSIKAQHQINDMLTGRMCGLTLLPLSQAELQNGAANFLDHVFADGTAFTEVKAPDEDELRASIICGGFPALQTRTSRRQRSAWMRHYLEFTNLRDVPQLRGQKMRVELKQLLKVLAGCSGSRVSANGISGRLQIGSKAVANYIELAEDLYLVSQLKAYSYRNDDFSDTKQKKLEFNDSGFLAILLGISADQQNEYPTEAGKLLETFVYSEIAKQCYARDDGYELGYWRSGDFEVDLVIKHGDKLVGIEVKHTDTPKPKHFKGLLSMARHTNERMVRGIVLCRSKSTYNYAYDRSVAQTSIPMQAVPVSALWSLSPQTQGVLGLDR